MIRFFALFLLPLTLFGSKILSYNIYERTDRADVMITFDTPYTGTIKQSKGVSKTILKLEDASIESSKIKKVNSKYLKSLTITPLLDSTQIVALTPNDVKLIASKTSDGYGLRLRFTEQASIANTTTAATSVKSPAADLSALPTKKSDDLSTSYYLVIAILVLGIIILFYLKNKMQTKQQPKVKQVHNSWLFKQNEQPQYTPSMHQNFNNEISIRFQKSLDTNNSVVMLDFLNQSYLVLIGNGNILLDKFVDNQPSTQEEFETILQNRHAELEEFLSNPTPRHIHSSLDGPLQSYKERAASLAYGE